MAAHLRWARERLGGGDGDNGGGDEGGADAAVDAEVLLAHATGQSAAALLAATRPPTRAQAERFAELVERRARGEPVAYLCGHKEFWSLSLGVTPATLIPRAETELLVERVLAAAASRAPATLLELGAGSGAIALALASELPGCAITATDISPAALEVAIANRQRLAAEHPGTGVGAVEFRLGDWYAAVSVNARFDIIVSNPPYIAAHDPHLQRGDLRFEPAIALRAANDGLAAIEQIIAAAPRHLTRSGLLLLEHGYEQAAPVRALFTAHGFTAIATHADLNRHPRVTEGRAG